MLVGERIAIYPESSEAEPWDRSSVGLCRFAVILCELHGVQLPRYDFSLTDPSPLLQLPFISAVSA